MELRHLRYFIAAAREENVSRAALKLHVSQPALSRQIRDLEAELGFPLLERTAKSVRLTGAGRVFLVEAQAVLDRALEAVEKARSQSSLGQGKLQVGYAPSPSVEILPRTLRSFQSKFPDVRVILHDLSAEEMLSQLHEGKLDLALTVRPSSKSLRGLNFVELARYPLCVAVHPGHALARARSVTIDKLLSEPLLGYTRKDYPDYYTEVEALFKASGRQPVFSEEHDSVTSLIAGVEAGHGCAIVPSCVACLAGPRLRLIPLKPPGAPLVVGILLREKPTPVADEFVKASSPANNRERGI
jgi:LysR family transcriptional regulator, benzoate and cis,cis-muconate-responsive activator of ben and cat genes